MVSFENSVEFYKALEIRLPDLILLDIMLPGDDGLTILKNLRNNTVYENIPVIIISAKDTELDRVKGLDLGADDYMCKPFGVMEMVSRILYDSFAFCSAHNLRVLCMRSRITDNVFQHKQLKTVKLFKKRYQRIYIAPFA